MTTAHYARHPSYKSRLLLFLPLLLAALGVLAAILLPIQWSPTTPAEHVLCDRAVEALLHSNDLVEIQRAGVIIREMPCNIGRRLTEDQE
jgi:hypothetical protein